jgi:acetylcholinesterase
MENVIVVTINYRLHVLGFMIMPSKGISGNAGLKDQQMALEWVHENISNFNGDPNRICLFGESSGAAAVHLQVLNPKSKKFISSAICQSGTALNDWNFQGNNEESAKSLAKLAGCKSDSIDEVYDTLMKASVQDLYENCEKIESKKAIARYKWRVVFEEESEDAFMTKSSIDLIISQGGKINIPMIFGSNNGDGMSTVAFVKARNKIEAVNENFWTMLPYSVETKSFEEANELAQVVKKFYFKGRELSEETFAELLTLRTDIDYLIPLTYTNILNLRHQPNCKQFLYEFQFDGKLNIQKKIIKLDYLPVAGHGDDVFYLFGGEWVDKVELDENSRERKMRKLMCQLWTNFAKHGDPTPDHDNPLPFKWNFIEPESEFDFLVLNDDPKIVKNLNKERLDFWKKVYEKHNKISFKTNAKL